MGKMQDYRVYHFKKTEYLFYFVEGTLLTACIAWLFYKSLWGMLFGIVFIPVYLKKKKRELCEKRKQRLCIEFKECLQSVSAALGAGYSIENAWKEAEKDLRKLLGEDGMMVEELRMMNRQIAVNVPIEELLRQFATRSGIEDVESFCQVFQFAKRGGGDLRKIIQNFTSRISEKIEITREIDTIMAAKKLEQKIMAVMPIFILLYVGLSSPEFLEGIYHNAFGVLLMSGCLLVYGGAVLLAQKIVDIQV